jgi:hypothetical protein
MWVFSWQCSSVVEQEIHTLYVGSSILPTALPSGKLFRDSQVVRQRVLVPLS